MYADNVVGLHVIVERLFRPPVARDRPVLFYCHTPGKRFLGFEVLGEQVLGDDLTGALRPSLTLMTPRELPERGATRPAGLTRETPKITAY